MPWSFLIIPRQKGGSHRAIEFAGNGGDLADFP